MAQVCDALRPRYDFILVDSPAGIEQGFQNAISGADRIIVVTTPEMSAVRDADRIIGLVEAAEKGLHRLKPAMVKRGDMLSVEDVLDVLAIPLLGVVPDDDAIVIATNDGTPVATDSRLLSGRAYQNIARRLLGEEVPLLDLRERGLFERLFGFMR
jgi:septum site-determining protein MinD